MPLVACLTSSPVRRTFLGSAALFVSLAMMTPAIAGGGSASGGAVAGGTDSATAAGGNGLPGTSSGGADGGGGGGAAGVTGGSGGAGEFYYGSAVTAGGAGGATAGANGGDGVSSTHNNQGGGGGGGGGAHGAVLSSSGALASFSGGNGGKGGDGPNYGYRGDGGGGGAGGYGAVATGSGLVLTSGGVLAGGHGGDGGLGGDYGGSGGSGGSGGIGMAFTGTANALTNTGSITGGDGGAGGALTNAAGSAGDGGAGGSGILGTAMTVINSGSISGGNGGAGGAGYGGTAAGANGAAGVGIQGSDLVVINSGTISGGLAGDGVTRNSAISFTGGTNTLQLQAGSTIVGNVVAFSSADTLALGGTANASFDLATIGTQYLSFGNLVKTGSGVWTAVGTQSATTSWAVTGGTLQVDGSIAAASLTTVESGAVLSGVGAVGNTQINSGGTFAPGNGAAGSSMAVTGNLAFQSGAIYLVQLTPAAASSVIVSGTATLGGATIAASFASGSYIEKRYTILTASSLSGAFASDVATSNLPAGFKTSLSYDAGHAYLDLALGFVAPAGLNGNQQAVGNALANYFNRNGRILGVYGGLTPSDLSQASGVHGAAVQQTSFDAMGQFAGMMLDPFAPGRSDAGGMPSVGLASGYAEERSPRGDASDAFAAWTKAPAANFAQRWSVWASAYGGTQTTDGNAASGSSTTTSRIYGTVVGVDYRFSPDTVAGFALAGGGTNFDTGALGFGHSDLFQLGAFLRHTEGPAYIAAALAYGWQDVTTERVVTSSGIDRLRAEFDANTWSGRLEGGYRFVLPLGGGVGLTPYAAAQLTAFDLPDYAEQVLSGSSAFALAYGGQTVLDTRSELGLRGDEAFRLGESVLTLRGRAAWAHDFNPDRSIAATFEALPGASFVANGATQAKDAALTTISAEMTWRDGWSVAATFDGEFSDVTQSYSGKGTVRYAW